MHLHGLRRRRHFIYVDVSPRIMGFKCSVPNCKMGYASEKGASSISLYRFPHDPCLRRQWLRAIHHEGIDKFTENWRVCAEHFRENDFVFESQDSHLVRIKQRDSERLKVKKLKSCTIPSKGHAIAYLSTAVPAKRPSTSSQSRLEKENQRILCFEEELFEKEKISDFNDLSEKLESAKLPSEYLLVKRDNFILFLYVDVSSKAPSVLSSVKVNSDLTLEVAVKNTPVSTQTALQDPNKGIRMISELVNLLAEVKALASGESTSLDFLVEIVIDLISEILLFSDIGI